jgi:hypothetical protein
MPRAGAQITSASKICQLIHPHKYNAWLLLAASIAGPALMM